MLSPLLPFNENRRYSNWLKGIRHSFVWSNETWIIYGFTTLSLRLLDVRDLHYETESDYNEESSSQISTQSVPSAWKNVSHNDDRPQHFKDFITLSLFQRCDISRVVTAVAVNMD